MEGDSNVCLFVFARRGHKTCFVCHAGMVAGLIFVFRRGKEPQTSRRRSNGKVAKLIVALIVQSLGLCVYLIDMRDG